MSGIDGIDTSTATLPSRYNAAKAALRDCTSVDECKEWADKASALASYAKQAKDDQLEKMAKRIRARATRRAGELLKQVDSAQGTRSDLGTAPAISRASAAADAGFSERQAKTAQRLANIPEHDFEKMVEADTTITKMAEAGTQKRESNRDAARALLAALKGHADRLSSLDVVDATEALNATQRAEARMLINRIDGDHDQIATRL